MAYLMEIIVALFGIILTVLGTLLITYIKDMKTNVSDMSKSMADMNIKLEKAITDQSWHKKEVDEVKESIKDIYERINAL